MKRVICSSLAPTSEIMQMLALAKKAVKRLKYNDQGAVYVSEEDDFTAGCSLQYLADRIKSEGITLQDIEEYPPDLLDLIDEHEAYCRTYSQVEEYTVSKYDILARYGLAKPKKSKPFYQNNKDILTNVYEIASCGKPLEDTLLHWAHSTSSVDTMIEKIVEVKNGKVIFRGGPYGLGIPAIILTAHGRGGDFDRYTRKTTDVDSIVLPVLDEIQDYLASEGINSYYDERKKALICDESDFN